MHGQAAIHGGVVSIWVPSVCYQHVDGPIPVPISEGVVCKLHPGYRLCGPATPVEARRTETIHGISNQIYEAIAVVVRRLIGGPAQVAGGGCAGVRAVGDPVDQHARKTPRQPVRPGDQLRLELTKLKLL